VKKQNSREIDGLTSNRGAGRGQFYTLLAFLAGILLLAGVLIFAYFFFFTNQLPLGGPDMKTWQVNPDFSQVSTSQYRWTVSYETGSKTAFRGLIRHATPVRMGLYPLITHDILVTSGEYADPNLVNTSVDILLHRFTWWSQSSRQPGGTINLLHTVPLNEAVYQQLLKIRSGDQVIISGREIDRIEAYELPANRNLGYWTDDGCNSIVVTGVIWVNEK
jgi:hypothetical protein